MMTYLTDVKSEVCNYYWDTNHKSKSATSCTAGGNRLTAPPRFCECVLKIGCGKSYLYA